MCVVCVSTVVVVSLLSPNTTPVVKNNINDYVITKTACPKSKVNKIENNRICLKNGKVYRWAIKKLSTEPEPNQSLAPIPSATPTATPSATPTATPGVMPSNTTIEILQNKFNYVKFIPKNYEINNVISFINISNNLNNDLKNNYTKQINKTLLYIDDFLPQNSKIDVLIITEKDLLNLKTLLSERYISYDWIYSSAENGVSNYIKSNNFSSGGIATQVNLKDGSVVGLALIWASSKHTTKDMVAYTVPHEIFHAYQFLMTTGIPKQNFIGQYPNLSEGKIYIACHMFEGGANLFGVYMASENEEDVIKHFNEINVRFKRNFSNWSDSVKLMKLSESWLNQNCEPSYVFGMYFYDWISDKYGVEKYNELLYNISISKNYFESIKNIFNKEIEMLYNDSSSYILERYNN